MNLHEKGLQVWPKTVGLKIVVGVLADSGMRFQLSLVLEPNTLEKISYESRERVRLKNECRVGEISRGLRGRRQQRPGKEHSREKEAISAMYPLNS